MVDNMQGFLIMLLICSVTMSALALFYMAVTPLLTKRYSVAGCYYSWLVIVVGLIIPFRPRLGNSIVKVGMPDNTAAPVIQIGNRAPVTVHAPASNVMPPALSGIPWWQIAAGIWLLGMILFLTYHMTRHFRFMKLAARWSENITDEQTLSLFHTLKTQMGISKKIGLQSCDSIGSPMLTGLVNPRILLPNVNFEKDELCFILKHELVHYRRKDLWYKCLVLSASAVHWFNPIVYLMTKAIDIHCELSCDEEVVRGADTDTRQFYSETIIGVVRYQSKLKTALSTNFYGGKKGMKKRIFSIMDMNRKKVGLTVLGSALILTLGTGSVFAANAEPQATSAGTGEETMITSQTSVAFLPDPDIYAAYAAFGITISDDGTQLLYKGQPVRLFADEKADAEAFYLNGDGKVNLSVARNAAGEITKIESITAQKAQEYQEDFFAEEPDSGFPAKVNEEAAQDFAEETVTENIQEGGNKYEKYQPFGITYSATSAMDGVLYFNGQRVKFFIDRSAPAASEAWWTDDAGTVNLEVIRDASGQITEIAGISDEKVREYQSAADEYEQNVLDGLEERVEERINERYAED